MNISLPEFRIIGIKPIRPNTDADININYPLVELKS